MWCSACVHGCLVGAMTSVTITSVRISGTLRHELHIETGTRHNGTCWATMAPCGARVHSGAQQPDEAGCLPWTPLPFRYRLTHSGGRWGFGVIKIAQ